LLKNSEYKTVRATIKLLNLERISSLLTFDFFSVQQLPTIAAAMNAERGGIEKKEKKHRLRKYKNAFSGKIHIYNFHNFEFDF
jgi:hypothetical protein